MSDSLWPHGLQHARPPCPSLSPGASSNSCPLNQWCHPTTSSSVICSSSCLSLSQPQGLCQWVDSSYQVAKVLELQHQSFHRIFRVDFLWDWPLSCPRDSQESSPKASILQRSAFFMVQLSHPYMTNGKTIALNRWTFVSKVMFLLFNMLFRYVTAFLPRNKSLLISWLQSPSTVILEPKKIKSVTVSIFSPSICHGELGLDALILIFWMLSFKPVFSLSCFTCIKRLFSSSSILPFKVVSFSYMRLLIFLPTILIPACT